MHLIRNLLYAKGLQADLGKEEEKQLSASFIEYSKSTEKNGEDEGSIAGDTVAAKACKRMITAAGIAQE